jgi:hypothetical protein
MSKREANVFQRLKLRITRPEDRFERIENGLGEGTPDVNYCMAGAEGWLEIKAPVTPVRESTALFGSNHPVSQEQSNWFLNQSRAGGKAYLFIASSELLLLMPSHIVENNRLINKMTLGQMQPHSIWSAKTPVNDPQAWIDLRMILTNRKKIQRREDAQGD